MNELIRMGRLLWPLYIQPFSCTSAVEPTYIHVDIAAKGTCMEMTIPSADHDVWFTRGISASTE